VREKEKERERERERAKVCVCVREREMTNGVRPDQIIVPLYKGAWLERATLLFPNGYMRSCAWREAKAVESRLRS